MGLAIRGFMRPPFVDHNLAGPEGRVVDVMKTLTQRLFGTSRLSDPPSRRRGEMNETPLCNSGVQKQYDSGESRRLSLCVAFRGWMLPPPGVV